MASGKKGFVDAFNNHWAWDPTKTEWDVQTLGKNGRWIHTNVSVSGNITHPKIGARNNTSGKGGQARMSQKLLGGMTALLWIYEIWVLMDAFDDPCGAHGRQFDLFGVCDSGGLV